MKREEKFILNTAVLAIGTFLPKLTSLVTLPLLTAYLTKDEYGTYDLIIVLASLILPAATLQIVTAAFRFLIECREDENRIKAIITNVFAFIVPVSIVALVITSLVLPISLPHIKLGVCIYYFVDIILTAVGHVARGLSKNIFYSLSSICNSGAQLIFIVLFVRVLRLGITGAIISLIVAELLAILFLFFKVKIYNYIDYKYLSKNIIKDLVGYSWPMVPNSLSLWVMKLSDRVVITSVMGISANAIYAIANKIPNLLTIVQSIFTMAWQENASIVSKDEDVGEYYSYMFNMMYNFYVGTFGVFIAITPYLFKLLIKGNYAEAYYHIPILFLGVFFNCLTSYLGGIYIAYKATRSVGFTTVCAAVCNLIIDLILVPHIGIYAASISTLISYFLLFIFRMINIRKYVKLRYNYKIIIFGMLVMIMESIFCYMQQPKLNIINGILGISVFAILNKKFLIITLNSFFVWRKAK